MKYLLICQSRIIDIVCSIYPFCTSQYLCILAWFSYALCFDTFLFIFYASILLPTSRHDSLNTHERTHTHINIHRLQTGHRCNSPDYAPSGSQPSERKVLLSAAFERQQQQRHQQQQQQQQQLIKYVCHHKHTHTHRLTHRYNITAGVLACCCCSILHLTACPAGGATIHRPLLLRRALFFIFSAAAALPFFISCCFLAYYILLLHSFKPFYSNFAYS